MSFKKGLVYVFIANFISLFISVITGFVLPKYLSIETYSNIKLFQLYITYVGILHLGFADGMYLKYGGEEIKNIDNNEIHDEFKTFKIFQLVVSILLVSVSLFIKNYILIFCSLSILPINVGNYLRNLYQATGCFDKYAKFTNINTFLIFIMNLVLLLIIKTDNYLMYIVFYTIAYFIYWLLLEIETIKIFGKIKSKFNDKYIINNVKNGFLLMLGNFCSVLFTSIDRLFVKNLLGMIKFAYYSFAVSIENLLNVFINPISVVMYNYFCKNKDVEKIKFVKSSLLLLAAIIIMVVFPIKFVVEVYLNKYIPALSVLVFLFAAQYFSIIVRCVYNNLYKAERRQNRYFFIMMLIIILSIVLNTGFYLINHSIVSFALATMITSLIWFIVGDLDFKQYRFSYNEYLYMILIVVSFSICGLLFNSTIGFIIYLMVLSLLSFLFMKKQIIYIFNEIKLIINKRKINKQED